MSDSDVVWTPLIDDVINTDGQEVIYVKDALLNVLGETYVYLPDNIRLCRATPAPVPQPVEMPTEAGWWAYDPIDVVKDEHVPFVVNLSKWELGDKTITYLWDWDDRPNTMFISTFRKTYTGKWYKLTMPWEQRPGAEVGDDE